MQRDTQLLFERGAPRLELPPFRSGDRTHFRIRRRIVDQAVDAFELAPRRPIGIHRLDDRRQFGKFA